MHLLPTYLAMLLSSSIYTISIHLLRRFIRTLTLGTVMVLFVNSRDDPKLLFNVGLTGACCVVDVAWFAAAVVQVVVAMR